MHILVGGIIQESNTFSPMMSTMENFRDHIFLIGKEMESICTENEISGFFDAASKEKVSIEPTLFGSAVSSGTFTKGALFELKNTLFSRIKQTKKKYDGVYFALHGAMVSEAIDDVEGELIEGIRDLIGKHIPFVVSLDLHANITKRMIMGVDGIVGFKTYPHVDFFETGFRAAKLLFSIVRDEIHPTVVMKKIPMIVPAENSQTSYGPFADLWKEASAGEKKGNSILTSLFLVQPWLDIHEMGSAVVVVGQDEHKANEEAERLAQLAWEKRHEFDIDLYSVRQIVELALEKSKDVPLVISDSADSPGAGATGDSNVVLKKLLELGVENKLACLVPIVDKQAVGKAIEVGVGERVTVDVGYSLNRNQGKPISVTGTVTKIGDGRFVLKGGYAKNTVASMGRSVVLQIGKISLLIGERATFMGDPSMYRSMGLEPTEVDIVLVKSANQFRADYEGISNNIYILDTPGCSPTNLKRLNYSKIERPLYPFDDHFNWK